MEDNKPEAITAMEIKIAKQEEDIDRLKAKLSMSSSVFLSIVAQSLDGVLIIDQKKGVVYANYAAIKLFDRSLSDLLNRPLAFDINPEGLLDNPGTITEVRIPKADQSETIAEISVFKTEWNNEPCYVVSFRDITDRKKSEKLLQHLATHDFLTNIPNRLYFEQKIEHAIQSAIANHYQMAILYIDIDNFKVINDTFGHAVGDLVLKKVATALQKSIRQDDVIARLGGDEFGVILTAIQTPEDAAKVASVILTNIEKRFMAGEESVSISVSIGLAFSPLEGISALELIKNADLAMYAAKSNGKNQYQFFSDLLPKQNKAKLAIIKGLWSAIAKEELFLRYQPIMDHNGLICCGFEALLRWNQPDQGEVSADQFLLCAEELGAMLPIGRWVIQQALNDYQRMKLDTLFLSINVSANECLAQGMEENIIKKINEREISAKNIILELTETVIIEHPEVIMEKFERLAALGIRMAMDDYGIGYSSLNLLKRLPLSILKIDTSFTSGIAHSRSDRVIIKSSIKLAHQLGLKIIAEGIETKEQADFLKQEGCDYLQGFYFSKALEVNELLSYVHRVNG